MAEAARTHDGSADAQHEWCFRTSKAPSDELRPTRPRARVPSWSAFVCIVPVAPRSQVGTTIFACFFKDDLYAANEICMWPAV